MYIRKSEKNDLNKVKSFYDDLIDEMNKTCYHTAWRKNIYPDEKLIAEFINEGSMFIGLNNEKIISAMAINHKGNELYKKVNWSVNASIDETLIIHILGVSLKEKGKGYGKEMINYVIDLAKRNNIKAIRMDVHITNITAMKLYEKMGFKAIENIKMLYEGIGEHEFVMYELPITNN